VTCVKIFVIEMAKSSEMKYGGSRKYLEMKLGRFSDLLTVYAVNCDGNKVLNRYEDYRKKKVQTVFETISI
jgi:hypothetical protein